MSEELLQQADELKLCPLCKEKASRRNKARHYPYMCGCMSSTCGVTAFGDTMDEAVRIWNTRKPDKALADEVKKYEDFEERVDHIVYDAFHNMSVPSMRDEVKTRGDEKNYVARLIKEAFR